ncbi:hypothetical protein BGW38_006566 [Lunasporangiospora selenospora]|uniref:Signal sequence receptor subunit alpha n=1 Tax=Lunasporangiospora selenospora TaxID=979761 RepID=A0A9P6FM18_9FUNG|nr:hypothetical protein BGW38_006566 [Lunasporangiospora selenospora]
MVGLKQTIKALVCGALFFAAASAQAQEEPQTDNSLPPGVVVTTEFPNAIAGLTPELINGEPNSIRLNFQNSGKAEYKVNLVVGSIVEMDDFNNIVRNLTAYRYGNTLKADSSLILPYSVKMEMPTREFGLVLLAEVMDSNKVRYPVLVYNSTVNFSEPAHGWLDMQLIFLYVLIGGIFVALGMFLKGAVAPEKVAIKKKATPMTAEEREAAVEKSKILDEDWIPENHKKSPRVVKRRA